MSRSLVPAVAAAAGWMESLKMPLRRMYAEYTKSELAMMAWRSGEMASNMHVDHQTRANDRPQPALEGAKVSSFAVSDPQMTALEERLGPVAVKLDEELDMRKLTGEEARRFLSAQGVHMPIGFTRKVSEEG